MKTNDIIIGKNEHRNKSVIYRAIKRLFDIISSILGLSILSPILIVISALIKANGKGSVLYRRICVGCNDKPFIMYKFRTMVSDADEYEKYFSGESLKDFLRGEKAVDDPRITKIGKWLRKSSLDELPQLISVLLGDMSIVGPRPVIEREAAYYGEDRAKLLSCKPGITGWWQVNGRGNLVYLSEETKRLQLYYVENQSLWLDIKILIKTVSVVLSRGGQDSFLYHAVKRVFDVLISGFALVVLSPLLSIIAILIKAEDGGSVVHHRMAVCKNGTYDMLKFRTMVPDANDIEKYLSSNQIAEYHRNIKLDNDPRVTRIGRLLRKTSLDELMQLVSVFKGDMSLVGPRPMVAEECKNYGDKLDMILSVKPGLTGYWQVNGRSNSTYENGERQRLELYYVENRSIWLDICIFFKTFLVVIRGEGAK